METIIHKELSYKVLCRSGFFIFKEGKKPDLLSRIRKTSIYQRKFFGFGRACHIEHNILGPGLLEHAYREARCVAVPIFIIFEN
jgi:hypothetical protein